MKNLATVLLIVFSLVLPLYGQVDASEETEEIQSLHQERLEIILYGIDSEISELIRNLADERNSDFNEELKKLLAESANIAIKEQIIGFFTETEYTQADDVIVQILEEYDEDYASLLTAAVKYVGVSEAAGALALVAESVEADNTALAVASIRTLGTSGNEEYQSLLQDYYEDVDFPEDIKPEIILALGDMKSTTAVPFLIDLLENDEEEPVIRRYACDSLRKIGDPAAIDPLLRAYEDDDVLLRSYVIYALSGFEGAAIEEMLMEGLRDSYVRVRISAAQGLGEKKSKQSVPILIYKAKKDPEPKVREEALKALGSIGTKEALDFVREILKNKRSNPRLRMTALYTVIEKDLENSIPLLEELIAEEWDKKDSRFLDAIGKQLSLQEHKGLKKIYSRFLDHPLFTIQLYGLRGIQKNNVTDLHKKVEAMSEEGNHRQVRKTALGILE